MSGYNLGVRTRMGIRDIADDSDTASFIRPRRPLDYQIRRAREALVHLILFACAFISIFTTLAIVFVLFEESIRFFADVSIIDFLTDRQWTPSFKPQHFGILPLMGGARVVGAAAAPARGRLPPRHPHRGVRPQGGGPRRALRDNRLLHPGRLPRHRR